jgi:large conductance mechanosensitive channel
MLVTFGLKFSNHKSKLVRVISLINFIGGMLLKEFKEFAMKGNMVDMAIGIIIGAAFGNVVNSLVNDIIMPPFGLLLGGMDFKDFYFVLKAADPVAGTPEVTFKYGSFITILINFLVVAWALFIVVKGMNKLRKSEETVNK